MRALPRSSRLSPWATRLIWKKRTTMWPRPFSVKATWQPRDGSWKKWSVSRATLKTKPGGCFNSWRRSGRIRRSSTGGVVMPRSGLCIHRVSGSSIAWFCVALLMACAWAPSAYCQATYVVNEPPAPQASQAVATLLAPGERLYKGMQHKEALQVADRALAAALEAGDLAGEALSHSARAAALLGIGRKAEAAAAWQASAGAWERAGEGPRQIEPLVSAALHLLAIDSAQARQLLTRALEVAKVERRRRFATADELERAATRLEVLDLMPSGTPVGPGEFLSIAVAVRHEAKVGKLLDEDKYPEAEALARGWLTEVEAKYGTDSLETARALAIQEKAWGPENASVASNRANLGQLLWEIGDLTEARRNYERALPVFEKLYGAESVFYAEGLSGLARVAASSGDLTTARVLRERVVTNYEKAVGPNHPDLGVPLINLALTLAKEGEPTRARPLYERALSLWEQARGAESPFVAVALSQLAGFLQETGDLVWARQLYERALAIQEKTFGANHATTAETLRGLAQLRAMTGEAKEAFAFALRAEDIGREHWQLIATTLSEREALAYAKERSSSLDLTLTLAAQERPTARVAWGAVVRSRALVLDEMAARHRTVSLAADPEMARLAEQLTPARERLARLVVRGPGNEPAERYHKLLDETRQEKERAERALAERSQAFREELARARIGFDDVAAALPSEAALVAYVRYRHADFTTPEPGSKRPEPLPHYLAFVWKHPQAEPEVVPLGPAAARETLGTPVRRQISHESRAPGRAAKRSEADYRQTGEGLRRAVWSPVSPYLGDARRVFIVPDGALHLVNFAALPTGHSSYLLETGPRIHYLSAERNLVPFGEQEKKGVGLLAIGAPAFQEASLFVALRPQEKEAEKAAPVFAAGATTFRGLRSTYDNFQAMQFEALSASAREAADITALWQRPGGMLHGAEGNAVQLTGAAASESAFKQQAAGKRVLHLATHGFFLGGKCASE